MGENLSATLTALGTVFTEVMKLVSTIVETFTSTPLLFITFGIGLTFTVIRIAKRLLNC